MYGLNAREGVLFIELFKECGWFSAWGKEVLMPARAFCLSIECVDPAGPPEGDES